MTVIPTSSARAHWAKTIDEAKREPVTVTEHGRETVVIMGAGVARDALAALAQMRAGSAPRSDDRFVPVENVSAALDELGADTTWTRELRDARGLVDLADPWAARR